MKTNTPLADALMLRIRDQYPSESEERHYKRFLEMVRNGHPELREEITKSSICRLLAAFESGCSSSLGRADARTMPHYFLILVYPDQEISNPSGVIA